METIADIQWDEYEWDESHFLIVLKDGSKEFFMNEACYATLWSGYLNMEKLFLLFPEHEQEGVEDWVDWVLNSDLFGEAFITKNYQKGLDEGFEVDIHQPTNFLFSAMAALRMPWEQHYCGYHPDFPFGEFLKMGFSEKQSFYLCINSYIKDGKLVENFYNSNHIPIPRTLDFDEYSPDNFRRQKGSMYERTMSNGIENNWPDRWIRWEDRGHKYSLAYLLGNRNRTIGDDLISFLKNKLKEEELELCVD